MEQSLLSQIDQELREESDPPGQEGSRERQSQEAHRLSAGAVVKQVPSLALAEW